MSANRKTTVAVIFGGRSVEHDVSVVTANQIMQAFDTDQYDVVPVYITRDGKWFTGEPLRDLNNFNEDLVRHKDVQPAVLSPSVQHHGLIINPEAGRLQKSTFKRVDVVFPAIHGSHGEDGTLQGILELADIPYVGCGVLASAVANDKAIAKDVLQQHGIPVIDSLTVNRSSWLDARDDTLARVEDTFAYPVFVKPATLGSSIGVARANDRESLASALDIAVSFDRRVLIEQAMTDADEINCAVMGYDQDIQTSVLEQPVSWDAFLTYEEKYMRGEGGMKGQERVIPAPLSESLTERIRDLAADAFRVIDGRGIARLDFLVEEETESVYLNEINTMPGSLSFYLWRESGLSNAMVVDHLVTLARDANADKRRNTYDYKTSLIENTAARGAKGSKGSSSTASPAASETGGQDGA